MNNKNSEVNSLENKIFCMIGGVFNTKYNWSLILATLLIWVFTGALFPYSNMMNFDMLTYLHEYIKILSIVGIILGLFKQTTLNSVITRNIVYLSILTYILSLITVIAMKNFGVIYIIGIYVFRPISIFAFLLLIKRIWSLVGDNISAIINKDNM